MDSVLFYPSPDTDHDVIASLGEIIEDKGDSYVIFSGYSSYIIKKEDVRPARMMHYLMFWRKNGFYKNLWNYLYVVIFFLIFIK